MKTAQPLPYCGGAQRNAMRAYSCHQLPEFDWLVHHPQLKSDIFQRFEQKSEQLQEAAELVKLHVFKRIPYRSQGAQFITRLQRQGLAQHDIALALAQAWLQDSNQFWLPKRALRDGLKSTWTLLTVSFVLSLLLLIVGLKMLSHISPEIEVYLLAFPPLLAVIGFLLMALIAMLLLRVASVGAAISGSRESQL